MTLSATTPVHASLTTVVDHTWLPEWPFEGGFDVEAFCKQAIDLGCAGVCVRLPYVAHAKALLAQRSNIQVATVIGFPLKKVTLDAENQAHTIGNAPLANKLAEIAEAKALGATELDVVWDVAQFLTGVAANNTAAPQAELSALMAAANVGTPTPVKLIIDTDILPFETVALAAQLCAIARVAMIET